MFDADDAKLWYLPVTESAAVFAFASHAAAKLADSLWQLCLQLVAFSADCKLCAPVLPSVLETCRPKCLAGCLAAVPNVCQAQSAMDLISNNNVPICW